MTTMIQEINAINHVLTRFKIDPVNVDRAGRPVYVRPGTTTASDTGNFVRYQVETLGKYAKVEGLARELNEAITLARGVDTYIRFTSPVFGIEVPHPSPVALPWALAPADLPRFGYTLGRNYSNGKPSPVVRCLTDSNSPHMLIVGGTGSGKTTMTLNAILTLARSTSPQDVALMVINPKPEPEPDVSLLNGLPHMVAPVITDLDDGVTALQSVVAEMDRRKREGWDGRRLVVNVHELAEFVSIAGDLVKDLTARLLQAGRGLGIHLMADTQHPLVEIVGSTNKANFPVTVVGKTANSDASRTAAPGWKLDAHRLPGKGTAYMVADGASIRIRSHMVDNGTISAEVSTIAARWGAGVALDLPTPPKPVDEVDALAARVLEAHQVDELVNGGELVRGAVAKAVRAIFGPSANTGGSNRTKAIETLNRIKGEQWAT